MFDDLNDVIIEFSSQVYLQWTGLVSLRVARSY